ncbi:uncharacterized protein LOC142165193 [Nicotiana tabacum]|uniref:Uncharacterized protein LOC142165193 n=1 Tax=Nicotiana tabacum TaxID=4097 RepID=A0AC58S4K0_TOBAC
MEYLNRSLKTLTQNPDFNFHPKCARLQVIHIYFADDLLMCCRADEVSMKLMMGVFDHFSKVSGLQANLEKELIIYSRCAYGIQRQNVSRTSAISRQHPIQILGSSFVLKENYNPPAHAIS